MNVLATGYISQWTVHNRINYITARWKSDKFVQRNFEKRWQIEKKRVQKTHKSDRGVGQLCGNELNGVLDCINVNDVN